MLSPFLTGDRKDQYVRMICCSGGSGRKVLFVDLHHPMWQEGARRHFPKFVFFLRQSRKYWWHNWRPWEMQGKRKPRWRQPIREGWITKNKFLKMLKANLLRNRNNHQNSVNCEHSIFVLGDVARGVPPKSLHFLIELDTMRSLWTKVHWVQKINQ